MQINNVALDSACAFVFSTTLAPIATGAAQSAEQNFSPANVPTLKQGDHVTITGPGSGNALALGGARINAAGQLVVAFINPTAGALTHATGVFQVGIRRA